MGLLTWFRYGVWSALDEPGALHTDDADSGAPVELPVDGLLDLHPFQAKDIRTLIPDYLEACRQRGIWEVRIVHGKGRGHLRRGVHALLGRSALVHSFRLAPEERGGWGATLVTLHPPTDSPR